MKKIGWTDIGNNVEVIIQGERDAYARSKDGNTTIFFTRAMLEKMLSLFPPKIKRAKRSA